MNKETIKQLVENYFKIDITTKTRKREYVEARAIYYKLLRDHTRMSLSAIGETMNKDHTTVLHFTRKIKDWMEYDPQIKQDYETLNNRILHAKTLNPDEFEKATSMEGFYEKEYKTLKDELSELQENNTKAYRLLVNKYNYLKHELNKSQPARIATGDFDLV